MCSLQYPADPGLLYLLAVFATSMMVTSSFALDGARFRYFGTWDGVKRSMTSSREVARKSTTSSFVGEIGLVNAEAAKVGSWNFKLLQTPQVTWQELQSHWDVNELLLHMRPMTPANFGGTDDTASSSRTSPEPLVLHARCQAPLQDMSK
ncbi:hypothetical protein L210DRAFT_3504497 [Boletus edulis BED1]|uniref:Uncharacterized protein n=1 Tax=Boletus edulis BED1 TaxID=1328754 RepID=A0AAD4GDU5_BOLED|nr:hypothetical protein L210DRAFT_3504497 [Boletus edulis BED1]